jgi:putative ABC transport system permease protein
VPGIAAGVVLSLILAPLLSSLLFGVGALDPTTFLTVSMFLFFVAAIACFIPARRATAIAPVVALRYE